jgi:hypothetical protein
MKEFIVPMTAAKKERDGSDVATFQLRDKIMSYLFEAVAGLQTISERDYDANDETYIKRHNEILQLNNELIEANKTFASQ